MSNRNVITAKHIGRDVPWDVAKPLIIQRLEAKIAIQKLSGCWEWMGNKNSYGYGDVSFQGRRWIVTRLMYTLYKGPIQGRDYICHTCDNPGCVNPLHLWAGKSRENLKDCVAKGRHDQASRTVCVNGHEFTPENTYVNIEAKTGKTKRHCKRCQLARHRIKAGWPRDLAMTLPAGQFGYRPPEVGGYERGKYDRKTRSGAV